MSEYKIWLTESQTEEDGTTIPHIESLSKEATLRVHVSNTYPDLASSDPISLTVKDLDTSEVTVWTARSWLVPCYEIRENA